MAKYRNLKIVEVGDGFAIRTGILFHRYIVPAFPAYYSVDELIDVSKEDLKDNPCFALRIEVETALADLKSVDQ